MALMSPGVYIKEMSVSDIIYVDKDYEERVLWENIRNKSKTNEGLKELMEKCEAYYRLIEENK